MCWVVKVCVVLGIMIATTAAAEREGEDVMVDPPSLPIPARDIPSDLFPPLADGRDDFHGWLFLPWEQSYSARTFQGWFYHHTPEFETFSPHDFEIMISGTLRLDNPVINFPLPPASDLIGTEYVFTPPSFPLDHLITSHLTTFNGTFSNGSFDTPQRYKLTSAQLTITNLTTIHYLYEFAPAGYSELTYLSFPRNPTSFPRPRGIQHFYFLHLVQQKPDFDQVIHVTIDVNQCIVAPGDSFNDIIAPGATFVLPGSVNQVSHRAVPSSSTTRKGDKIPVLLMTSGTRHRDRHTICEMAVIEEVHCVTMPDSFAKCPPVAL